jgi:hypothetical protein
MLNRLEQIHNEDMYSKKHIRRLVREDIERNLDGKITKCKQLLADFLAKEYLYSRGVRVTHLVDHLYNDSINGEELVMDVLVACLGSESQSIQAVCGAIYPSLKYEEDIDGVKMLADILFVLCESDLYDIYHNSSKELCIRSVYKLEPITLQAINRTKFLPVMRCKPNKVVNNKNCGFLTFEEHCILKRHNHHDLKISLDVLNYQNSIELCIDPYVFEWEYEFKMKPEYENKTALQLKEIQDQHEMFKVEMYKTTEDIIDNNFYLIHRFDSRGRIYCSGYEHSYQGSEYQKALINIAKKEFIEVD